MSRCHYSTSTAQCDCKRRMAFLFKSCRHPASKNSHCYRDSPTHNSMSPVNDTIRIPWRTLGTGQTTKQTCLNGLPIVVLISSYPNALTQASTCVHWRKKVTVEIFIYMSNHRRNGCNICVLKEPSPIPRSLFFVTDILETQPVKVF